MEPAGGPVVRSCEGRPCTGRGLLARWRLWGFALLLLCHDVAVAQEATGGVRGTIMDKEFDTPLSAVTVSILETGERTESNESGHFVFQELKPGAYTVVATRTGFERIVRGNVVVAPGDMTNLALVMNAEYMELQELVVRPLELDKTADADAELANDLSTKLAKDLAAQLPTEAGLLNLRAESAGIVDAVGKDMMSKAGAGNAADAMKLVAGATISGDKYAVIRGLSDRFVNTTVNSIVIPTADPDVRAVQLDLFPSALLDSMRVYKTFTPDLPGNTSGGSVDIVTPSPPDKFLLEVKVGTGYNSNATGNKDFLTSGQKMDYFGLDEGDREQSLQNGEVAQAKDYPRRGSGESLEDFQKRQDTWRTEAQRLEGQTRSLSRVLGPTREAPPPNHGWGLTYGDSLKLAPETRLGWLSTFTYSDKYTHYEGVRHNLHGSSDMTVFEPLGFRTGNYTPNQWDAEGSRHTVGWGYGQVLELKHEDYSLKLNYLRTQQSDDLALNFWDDKTYPTTFEQNGQTLPALERRNESLTYTMRSLESLQLLGVLPLKVLDFPDLMLGFDPGTPRVEWAVATSEAIQDQPDQRFFQGTYDAQRGQWYDPGSEPFVQRSWRNTDEDNDFYRADLIWPFEAGPQRQGQLKTGWSLEDTTREFTQDTFYYENGYGATPYAYNYAPFDEPWTQVFLEPQRLGYPIFGTGADYQPNNPGAINWVVASSARDLDYTGTLRVPAYYGMGELPIMPWFKFIGGARVEETSMATKVRAANGQESSALVLDVRGYVAKLEAGDLKATPAFTQANPEAGQTLSSMADASLEQTDMLPSLSFVLDVVPSVKLRGTWSRTIGRPTFKELTPVVQQEYLGAQGFAGNPTLTISELENYDLRLEANPGDGQLFSVSAFRKDIIDPIDYSNRSTTEPGGAIVMPFNYPEGEITGFELEARQDLGRFQPCLRGLSLGGSYTLLEATVTLPDYDVEGLKGKMIDANKDPEAVDSERPMKDQPDFLASLYAMYDIPLSGTSVALFLTKVGDTLVAGESGSGVQYAPNRIRQPYLSLDLSISQKVGQNGKLSLGITNLLDPKIEEVWQSDYVDEDEAVASSYRKGRTFSLSYTLKW